MSLGEKKEKDEKPIIHVEILDGFSFRHVIDILAKNCTSIKITFTQEGFELFETNTNRIIGIGLKIYGSRTLAYNYSHKKKQFSVCTVVKKLSNIVKDVKKVDSKIYIDIFKNKSMDIITADNEHHPIIFEDFTEEESHETIVVPINFCKEPIFKIPLQIFSEFCSKNVKCDFFRFLSSENGFNISGFVRPDKSVAEKKFGYVNTKNNSITITVPSKIIKTLSKIHNVCTKGIIYIYVDEDMRGGYLKLSIPITYYGVFELILTDQKIDDSNKKSP